MAGNGDHDRNIGAERPFDQIAKALALALLPSEAIDDEEIGALIDRTRNLASGVEQLPDIEPAAGRTGPDRSWNSCSSSPVCSSIAESCGASTQ